VNGKEAQSLVKRIRDLHALPTLPPEAYREASDLIQELVGGVDTLDPGEHPPPEVIRDLVRHLRKIGDPSAAETVGARSAELLVTEGRGPEAAWLLSLAGLACADQGMFEEAGACYVRGLRLVSRRDPLCLRTGLLSNYGNAFTELEQFEAAVGVYNRALQTLEGIPDERLRKAGRSDRAVIAGAVANNLGWCYMRRARKCGADSEYVSRGIAVLERALETKLRPRTRIMAAGNLAELHLLKNEPDEAEKLLSTLERKCKQLGLEKLLPEVYTRRAQLCASREDVEHALSWCRNALRSSLLFINQKQELRIVRVFLDMLSGLLAKGGNRLVVLESSGAPVLKELLSLLRSKDWYTGGDHSRRVARLSRQIASLVGEGGESDEAWLKQVELGGLLHDVGKLTIPWSLLNKIRPLVPRDVKQLHRHASAGEEILKRLDLPDLAVVVGAHHERPDGTGYPRALRKTTLAGAVVAAADAYEAMTSPSRRYRRPKAPQEAAAEVVAGAGSQFDPEVARVLAAVVLRKPNSHPNSRHAVSGP